MDIVRPLLRNLIEDNAKACTGSPAHRFSGSLTALQRVR